MKYSLCLVLAVLVSSITFFVVSEAKKKSTDNEDNNKKYEQDFEFIDEVSEEIWFEFISDIGRDNWHSSNLKSERKVHDKVQIRFTSSVWKYFLSKHIAIRFIRIFKTWITLP